MVEALVLAGLGGVAGLALASLGVTVLQRIGRGALPRLDDVGFHSDVLLFAFVVTMTTAIVCGVTPALRLSRSDPNRPLMQRSATGTRRYGRLSSGLAAAQLALALALVTGAGVLSVSFYNVTKVDFGFGVDRVLTFEVNLPSVRYDANRRAIIGVVGDVTLDIYGTPSAAIYSAHRQFAGNRNWVLTQVVSTDGPPDRILPAVRGIVASIDPELALYRPAAMTDVLGGGTSREHFALVLMAAFAAVSLTLAAVGLYGVLAYAVRERTRELGIRIALGATAPLIRLSVLRQASVILITGIVAGTIGALALGRWLTSLTFGISPSDPRIVATAAAVLAMTGLVAAWLPARRAARIEARVAIQEG